jgi:hypothetical protein
LIRVLEGRRSAALRHSLRRALKDQSGQVSESARKFDRTFFDEDARDDDFASRMYISINNRFNRN